MKKYQIVEGIATADVAYEIYGVNLRQLFANAAEAVEQTMVDLRTVNPVISHRLSIVRLNLEDLFLDFLNELLFLKDSERKIFSEFEIFIAHRHSKYDSKKKDYFLLATLKGEKIDPKRHHLRCDVKAITRHKFYLKKTKKKCQAQIILDI